MRRITFLFVAALAVTGCKGPKGSTGADGAQGPVGPIGPAGPLTVPPHITDVLPHGGGSANNIWTIVGENFSATDTNDTVWFNGHAATVVTASPTQLVVSDPFPALASPEVQAVTVEANDQTSNTVPVMGFPNGTERAIDRPGLWKRADRVAETAATTYVVAFDDSDFTVNENVDNGLYAFDHATRALSLVARSNANGLNQIEAVFAGPGNTLWIADGSMESVSTRLLKLVAGHWQVQAFFNADHILDVAFDAQGGVYAVTHNSQGGTDTVSRFDAAGFDQTFGNPTLTTPVGAVFQNGALFVSDSADGKIVTIDAMGTVTDFTADGTLPSAGALTGDGANLFVIDSNGIDEVDNMGAITNFTAQDIGTGYTSITGLARTAGGEFVLAQGSTILLQINDADGKVLAASLGTPVAMEKNGDDLLVSTIPSTLAPGGVIISGMLLDLHADGSVTNIPAPTSGIDVIRLESATSAIVYDEVVTAVYRVNLTSGVSTMLADATALTTNGQCLSILLDAAGNIYVLGQDSTGNFGAIHKISAAGVVTQDFMVDADAPTIVGGVLSGTTFVVLTVDSNTNIIGLYKIPLAAGAATHTLFTPAAAPFIAELDGIEADGKTGYYAADVQTGNIYHVLADGSEEVFATVPTQGAASLGIDVAADGDVVFADINNLSIRAMMP